MSDSNSEGFFDNDWDECGDLVWNEFDWERYLRQQDDLLHRYLAYYERLKRRPDRIDEVAHRMGWDVGQGDAEALDRGLGSDGDAGNLPSGREDPAEPYTLQKNPVYVSTKALYLSLKRAWERLAADPAKVPQALALAMQTSHYRGEEHAGLGVQALDVGDFAMAVSLFKRALEELNRTLALAGSPAAGRAVAAWREDAVPRLFDLREIWLRVINECRGELNRLPDEEN